MPVIANLTGYDAQIEIEDNKIVIHVTPVFAGFIKDDLSYDGTPDSSNDVDAVTKLADDRNIPHESTSLSQIYFAITGVLMVVLLGSYFVIRKRKLETNESTSLLDTNQKSYHTQLAL
jgi:hypothetical protein